MSILSNNALPKISTLSNGLKVATIHIKSSLTTLGLWVRSGSIYETEKNNGTAHFLEHMIFRGNEKYPKDILEDLAERKGINIRAATSRVVTSFFAHMEQSASKDAIDALCQVVFNPDIKESSVEDERPTILAEENEVNHNFTEVSWDLLHSISYNNSLRYPILGSTQNIKTITADMIRNHHSKYFNHTNAYFIAATSLPHEKIVEMVSNSTDFLKPSTPTNIENELPKSLFKPSISYYGCDFIDDISYIATGLEGPSVKDPKIRIAQILANGINDSSLGQNLHQRSPLASKGTHELQALTIPYNDTSLIAFLGKSATGKEDEFIKDVLNGIVDISFKQDKLDMAKNLLKSKLLYTLSSSSAVADELGLNLLLRGSWIPPKDIIEETNKISLKDVQDFYNVYIANKNLSAAFILPSKFIQKSQQMARQRANVQSKNTQSKQPQQQHKPQNPLSPNKTANNQRSSSQENVSKIILPNQVSKPQRLLYN